MDTSNDPSGDSASLISPISPIVTMSEGERVILSTLVSHLAPAEPQFQHLGKPVTFPHTTMADNSGSPTPPMPVTGKKTSASMAILEEEGVFGHMSLISPAFSPVDASPIPSTYGSQVDLTAAEGANKVHKHKVNPEVEQSLEEILPEVFCESRARIPTTSGTEIFLHLYKNNIDQKEHLAIVFGQDIHSKTLFSPRPGETEHDRMTRGAYVGKLYPGRTKSDQVEASLQDHGQGIERACKDTLVRIHSECYTGETAWSARCDCGEQLDEAARLMAEERKGVIVYLRQEGRGIGLGEKLKAYNLQDLGADTVTANLMLRHPADARSFGLATAILLDLGLEHIRLLTNNPDKIVAVEGRQKQVKVTQRVPMIPLSWQNKGGFKSREVDVYLKTKVQRMGHLLNLSGV
jgi:GTP cyclohydrolase II